MPRFGLEKTKAAWDSQAEAVRLIEDIVRRERIECEFKRVNAFLYTPTALHLGLLEDEVRHARQIGYAAESVDPAEVPFPALGAVRFPDQGKFHVRQYLLALAERAEALGVEIHEGTDVRAIEDVDAGAHVELRTDEGRTVKADRVVSASNVPFDPAIELQTKLYPYRTYALSAEVPKGIFGEALYWDTLDPYHYTRVEPKPGYDVVILGGEDRKVGSEVDTGLHHNALRDYLQEAARTFSVLHEWSGEILETEDDLPYIGRVPGSPNHFVITGDSGTGMTNGTIGAYMVSEQILGRKTPWDALYNPGRVTLSAGTALSYAKRRAQDLLEYGRAISKRSEVETLSEVEVGMGVLVRDGLQNIAVSRSEDGELHALDATCTHLGCTVRWNRLEQSWDCPCHGSRFDAKGRVLHGPAVDPLEEVAIRELPRTLVHGERTAES
jgi:glycine/D-amino acid oxidase-like deaminating enzyme/nitrite reductase/ring-hydroxylating ferredoxin subunit